MHRIDGPGFAPGNLWTEGNPQTGVPATTVTDDFQNDLQEEICNTIEAAGITLQKGVQTQLLSAISELVALGGSATQIKEVIANPQASATDIAGLVYDKANFKAVMIDFELNRKTDTNSLQEIGQILLSHDPLADAWRITVSSNFDDAGVTFSVTGTGQVQYTSDTVAGANYVGHIRVAKVTKFKQ